LPSTAGSNSRWRCSPTGTGYPLEPARARLFSDSLGDRETFGTLLSPLLAPQRKRLLPEAGALDSVLARFDELAPGVKALAGVWRKEGDRIKSIPLGSKALSRAQKSPNHLN
jgi:hypothetical protein